MKFLIRRLGLIGLFSLLGCSSAFCQSALSHLGLGLNYGGGQIDWRSSPQWMFEARAQSGANTEAGDKIRSSVAGVRVYRFLRGDKKLAPLLGLEIAAVKAKQSGASYEADGFSAGGFAGLGLKITRHLLFEFDAGPYVVKLTEKQTNVDKTEVNLVGDGSLIFFF